MQIELMQEVMGSELVQMKKKQFHVSKQKQTRLKTRG